MHSNKLRIWASNFLKKDKVTKCRESLAWSMQQEKQWNIKVKLSKEISDMKNTIAWHYFIQCGRYTFSWYGIIPPVTTDEFSRNLNGFSLAENLFQKALLTVMLLHRPANAEIEDESWKHSFHVDSLIHFVGDLFILDINWPILPPAFVWEAVENTKINIIHLQFTEVILCSDHIKQVKKLVLQVGKHNA